MGPQGPQGIQGDQGVTGPAGTMSTPNGSLVARVPQIVANLAAVRFRIDGAVLNNVTFNGADGFIIDVPGNYYVTALVMPLACQASPIAIGIGFNGNPLPAIDGATYGVSVGQQTIAFGTTGNIPAGTVLRVYNLSGQNISLGGDTGETQVSARFTIFKLS